VPSDGDIRVTAMSDDGSVVVGSRQLGSGYRALRWDAAGRLEVLPELPSQLSSEAWQVSADGSTVSGRILLTSQYPYADGRPHQPFRWTREGGFALGDTPGSPVLVTPDARAAVIATSPPSGHAVWREGEGVTPLPLLDGSSFGPAALSADGATVIGSEDVFAGGRAVRWTEPGGAEALGSDDPFFLQPYPTHLSEDGAVALGADGVAGAFRWDAENGLRRLGDVLRRDYRLDARGWEFLSPYALSRDGRVAIVFGFDGAELTPFEVVFAAACDDGADNDGDGALDLADGDCASPASNGEQPRPRCGLGFELALVMAPLLAARRRRERGARRRTA
jgi:hypothetical protein